MAVNQQEIRASLSKQERDLVRRHLRTVLESRAFARSVRARDFLSMVVRNAASGNFGNLRERMIGAELFGRSIDYDTGSDSVVRVAATEVRKRLRQFYLESAQESWPVRIALPAGSYVPQFKFVSVAQQIESPGLRADKPETALYPDAEPLPTDDLESTQIEEAPAVFTGAELGKQSATASKWRLIFQIAAAVLVLALMLVGAYKYWVSSQDRGKPIRSVVILPLKNLSGDAEKDYFADGITAELINSLGKAPALRVISLTSSMNLKNSKKMIPEIAHDLNVQGVIEGDVQWEGNRVRINIELVDGRRDRPIWSQTYTRDVDSTLTLQQEVAADIVREVTSPVASQPNNRSVQQLPHNSVAHTAYLRGLVALEGLHDKAAFDALQQAVQADPQFAPAHSSLAECIGRMAVSGTKPNREAFEMQKSEALQAISLDPSLAEAHAELADAVMALDWDWSTAGREYQRALQLNPNSADIHQKYAIYLIFQGQPNEAIKQVEIGTDLDPISAVAIRNQVFVYFFARKYDKVLSLISTSRSVGMDPPASNFFLGALYAQKRQYQNSIDLLEKASQSPHNLGHLGSVYALSGNKQAALKSIAMLQADIREQGIGQYETALVYTALGDKTSAVQWLKRAAEAHDVGLLYIKVDPFLDPLRAEPEFKALVRSVGLNQ